MRSPAPLEPPFVLDSGSRSDGRPDYAGYAGQPNTTVAKGGLAVGEWSPTHKIYAQAAVGRLPFRSRLRVVSCRQPER